MNFRVILLIIVAVGAAIVTTQYVRNWLETERSELEQQEAQERPQEVPKKQVLVAAQRLLTGKVLQRESLRWQAWPETQVTEEYIVRSNDEEEGLKGIVGAVVRQDVAKGTPVVSGMYLEPGDKGFLSAILKPGMRAVSIPVDNAASVHGLIFPGDRVDVVMSHQVESAKQGVENGRSVRASETILSDIRVVALDQRTSNPDNEPATAQTVTLEVAPKQAEQLTLAQQLGSLRLSLRSIVEPTPEGDAVSTKMPSGSSPTLDSDVSALIGGTPSPSSNESDNAKKPSPFELTIVRGGSSETRTFDGGNPDRASSNSAGTKTAANKRDCSDFGSQADAQAFFEKAGPGDPHNLDADGDGRACERIQ